MSRICVFYDVTFPFHTRHVIRIDQRLSSCILRFFISRDSYFMWPYLCVWFCHLLNMVHNFDVLIFKVSISVQCSFTKHIFGMQDFDYYTHLSRPCLYSLQRIRERYIIIYTWKIIEKTCIRLFSFNYILYFYQERSFMYN